MKKVILIACGVLLVVITLGAAGCTDYFGSGTGTQAGTGGLLWSQQNTGIWVIGVGKVTVVPDIAMLSLGIEAQAATIAEAQQEATQTMASVMRALSDFDIAQKDIQTQFFSVQPVSRWDNGKEVLIGYRVANFVTIKIRNIADAGSIIDATVAAGGDNARVNSISFTLDNPDTYNEQAREGAMADAKAKAKQLANLGGVKLGKPTYINESGGYVSPPIIFREGKIAEAATTPISPGEMEIQLTVQVVFSIS